MSKRSLLMEAASRIVVLRGLHHLTLDAVAEEAGVSKGGLLYHFPSKEALVQAMNDEVIARFRRELEAERVREGSFSRAYAKATVNQLADTDFLQLNASLLAAVGNNPDILRAWTEEYEWIARNLEEESGDSADAAILRLVCDGLWFSRMFHVHPVKSEQQDRIMELLLSRLEEKKS